MLTTHFAKGSLLAEPGSKPVMQFKLLRLFIQVAALAVFMYQMVVATGKYFTFTAIPSHETKDIADAKLPTIFLCVKDQEWDILYIYISFY